MSKEINDPEDPTSQLISKSYDHELAGDLLFAVQSNNDNKIRELIKKNANLLDYQYATYEFQTILLVACNDQHSMENVTKDTIKLLITLGAKYSEVSKSDYWEPIHYTAINCNKQKMEAILEYLSPEELNSLVTCSKRNIQKFCKNKKVKKTYSNNALSILLKFCNEKDQFEECCQLLIDRKINVNQSDSEGVTPSDIIWKLQNPTLLHLINKQKNKREESNSFNTNFGYLRLNSVNKFLSLEFTETEANGCDFPKEEFSSCTLLQMCCEKGLTACVKHLLSKGASVNKIIKKNPECPILIAIRKDHEDIVRLFLERTELIVPENILLELQIMYNNHKKISVAEKYMKMFLKYLLQNNSENNQKFLRYSDEFDRSVLYYAVHYKCTNTILTLLSMGASLVTKDIFGYAPLDFIEPSVLKKFLDNSVSNYQEKEHSDFFFIHTNVNKFTVTIDYKNLVEYNQEDYIEMSFLDHMVKNPHLNSLLNHPVIASFLYLKWNKCKWWVYFNLSLYCITYFSLFWDGFVLSRKNRTSNILLWFSYVPLFLRLITQILMFRVKYLKRVESYFDFFLVGAITYIILATWIPRLNDKNVLVACSIVFLTSTLGIFTQIGNLSYFTVKVTMLKQISINFFKTMLFYMFPVMAFVLSFYMLSDTHDMRQFFTNFYGLIIMYAGEADEELLKQFETNPIFGHTIYLLSVILIGVILHNLLIGLAVSDLQNIEKDAEFICKKEQARYIVHIEKLIYNKYKNTRCFKKIFRKFLIYLQVFNIDRVLMIQYSSKDLYLTQNTNLLGIIRDKYLASKVHKIYKNRFLNDYRTEDGYTIKTLHDKIEKLENLLSEYLKQNKNQKETF